MTPTRAATVGAILLGLAIPSLVAGRVPIAVALALGSMCLAAPWAVRGALTDLPNLARHPVAVAVTVTLGLWLVSAFMAEGSWWAIQVWAYVAGFVVLGAFLNWRMSNDARLREVFFRTTVLGCLCSVAIAAVAVSMWWEILTPLRIREIGGFDDAQMALRGYGSALPIMAAVALYAGWRLGGGAWLWAAALLPPLSAVVLVETGGMSGWLGYLSAILVVALGYAIARMRPWPARFTAFGLVLAALAAATWLIAHLPPIPYGCEPMRIPAWALDHHRQVIWAFSLEHALERPWFGFGIEKGGAIPGAKQIIPCFQTVEYLPSHSHNWMFELFLETGALGLLAAIVALLLHAARLTGRLANSHAGALAALAVVGAFWGSGLVNFSIWAAWWQWCFLLPTAAILADMPRLGGPTTNEARADTSSR